MAKPIPDLPERIIQKFNSYCSPPDANGCIIWTGRKYHGGYGYFRYKNRQLAAHRVAYHLKYGCNEKLQLNHCCVELSSGSRIDNPGCVNPDHLYEGTARDNFRDAMKRGTVGKLCFNDASKIREEYKNGKSVVSLASIYKVHHSHIRAIIYNKVWIDESYQVVMRGKKKPRRIPLEEAKIIEIKTRYVWGENRKDLRDEFKISKTYMDEILTGLKKIRTTKTEKLAIERANRKKFKEGIKQQLRKEFLGGAKIEDLMIKYNIKHYPIHCILEDLLY